MVWTGDGRVFFYNPSSRTSVWERPEELLKRTDVDKMVANPPDSVPTSENKADTQGVKTPATKAKRSSEDSESEGEAPAAKKPKIEVDLTPTSNSSPFDIC